MILCMPFSRYPCLHALLLSLSLSLFLLHAQELGVSSSHIQIVGHPLFYAQGFEGWSTYWCRSMPRKRRSRSMQGKGEIRSRIKSWSNDLGSRVDLDDQNRELIANQSACRSIIEIKDPNWRGQSQIDPEWISIEVGYICGSARNLRIYHNHQS